MSKSNNPSYIPVVIVLVSIGLFLVSSQIESFTLQTKIAFIAKCGVIIGAIGLLPFTIIPLFSAKKNASK